MPDPAFAAWLFSALIALAVFFQLALALGAQARLLRNERIVALGMQAAGAAHEMGTPLSTLSVVIGELKQRFTLELLLQGVDRMAAG